MLIEIIFDPSCPWCFIGQRQLDRALALRPELSVRRRWWPFLLNPDLPPDGADRMDFLVRKFGSEARVGRIYRAIAHVGQSVNIAFAFDRIGRSPNTVNAHRLVRYADRFGCADAVVEALFSSYFVKGHDIGDVNVLLLIGHRLGLNSVGLLHYLRSDADLAVIHEENARAHRLGINGVPSFVFSGGFVICGAQDPVVLARMLDVAREAQTTTMAAETAGTASAWMSTRPK
jgi:predicted DsbA family dithiol-disulfide isomerase